MTKELGDPYWFSSAFANHYSGGLSQQGIARSRCDRYFTSCSRPPARDLTQPRAARNVSTPEGSATATRHPTMRTATGTKQGTHCSVGDARPRWLSIAQARRTGRRHPRQNKLGILHETGDGVTKSYVEAAKWYRRAADRRDIPTRRTTWA